MNVHKLVLSLFTVFAAANLSLAEQPTHTVITVEKMHCAGCAKKIAAQLYTVRGVKEVRADVPKKLLVVLPQANATASPRAMWEAVEKGQDRPLQLAGPSGTFNTKPQF